MFVILLFLFFLSSSARAQQDILRQAARLDSEQNCEEAGRLYQQALGRGPASQALLNNVGNHHVLCGDPAKARASFEGVLKLNPQHGNANLQLARIAVDRHDGARALEYLSRIPAAELEIRMLRAEALHWAGKQPAALALLEAMRNEIGGDQRLLFSYGLTCARTGLYDRAETVFNQLLAQHPDDFDVLFNLGRAAARARHYDRAQRALEVALRLRPDHVDSLLELGEVNAAGKDYARSIFLLAKARQLAPLRPDVALSLARAALAGEYYGDAALAYDEYLRLKPGDDGARRDRAFAKSFTDGHQSEGLKELYSYVEKHPDDPLGYFDLAQLTWRTEPEKALRQLAQALRRDPSFAAAHVSRGWLLNRLGRAAEALPHLQKANELNPGDPRTLDQLGLTYDALDRPADAEKVLRQALAIAPGDADVLMHLGRALMELGREEEARPLLEKFRKSGPVRARGPWKRAGLIESATLSASERSTREIDRLRSEAGTHPDDPELQFRLASLLMANGRTDEARTEFQVLLTRNPDSRICREAGAFLLGFDRLELARSFLERAAAAMPSANLDLAMAIFQLEGPAKALLTLELVPETERTGDYLLLQAKLMDAEGRIAESEKILEQGLRLSTSRPRVLQEAALLLLQHDRKQAALDLLNRAAVSDPDLLLLKGAVLALLDRNAQAEALLKEIELQWPEWDRAYLVHGLILEHREPREAVQKLWTAVALGSRDIAANCALSRFNASPRESECSCAGGLADLFSARCNRPR